MNPNEQPSNSDSHRNNIIADDDKNSKKSGSTCPQTENKSLPLNINIDASSPRNGPPSEVSDSDSIPDNFMLTPPLGNPNLKNLNYIEAEVPIYANLYKIELERNYTLYEYAVTFAHERDDKYTLSTPFKQRIINTVSSKIAQNYKNFIFIGGALFSEKKSKVVVKSLLNITLWNISSTFNLPQRK